MQEITAGIEQGIKELFRERQIPPLPVRDVPPSTATPSTTPMLIYMQRPRTPPWWPVTTSGKNQFSRHVKRGEHGITIIAPTPYKKKIEGTEAGPGHQSPHAGRRWQGHHGGKGNRDPLFRPVKVFDVSQTDGKPLPELASSLSGNVQNYEVFMEAPAPVRPGPHRV